MLDAIAATYRLYGFEALESGAVETVDALGKFLPDVDRPNEGVFAWQEAAEGDGPPGEWLALRYDLTAPLARVYAQHRNDLPLPYRRYAIGPVWRNEKPGPGRYRQFMQCDADTVGSSSMAADAEICAMLADTLERVGIARGDYAVRINNRKILNGVLETAGVGEDAPQRDGVLRVIDKFDRVGEAGVRELLTAGRLDDSGAFIDGAGLDAGQVEPVVAFLTSRAKAAAKTLENLREAVGGSKTGAEGIAEAERIMEMLDAAGYGPERVALDPSVVRGLAYYTGPVFEAELTFEIRDEKGRRRQFGSVAGGGRYDGLVKRFTGPGRARHRRVDRRGSAVCGAARDRPGRSGGAGPGDRHGDGSRQDGGLPGDGERAAARGRAGGGLSGKSEEFRRADEIRRPPGRARSRDRRAGRAGPGRRADQGIWRWGPNSPKARLMRSGRPGRASSRSPAGSWSRGCAAFLESRTDARACRDSGRGPAAAGRVRRGGGGDRRDGRASVG